MIIAIAIEGKEVSAHFASCLAYTIAEIENGDVKETKVFPNAGYELEFIPAFLAAKGVTFLIAGGMGPREKNLFSRYGIEVITDLQGKVEEALESFLMRMLKASIEPCTTVTVKFKNKRIFYACR